MRRTGGCSSSELPNRRWGAADCRWTTVAAGRAASPHQTLGPQRASRRIHLPAPCARTLLLGCTAAWALPAGNPASPRPTASSGLVCCRCLMARRCPGRGCSRHAPAYAADIRMTNTQTHRIAWTLSCAVRLHHGQGETCRELCAACAAGGLVRHHDGLRFLCSEVPRAPHVVQVRLQQVIMPLT